MVNRLMRVCLGLTLTAWFGEDTQSYDAPERSRQIDLPFVKGINPECQLQHDYLRG